MKTPKPEARSLKLEGEVPPILRFIKEPVSIAKCPKKTLLAFQVGIVASERLATLANDRLNPSELS
jgi:hypothetical protein